MLKISYISSIIGGNFLQRFSNAQLQYLLLDSRKVSFPEQSLFFAIKGDTYNGHDFLDQLYAKGVRNFVVSQTVDVKKMPEANILNVTDSLRALQKLAVRQRGNYTLPVIGITGSNGKTVVKEWLYQLLWPDYNIVRSPKSYNSQVGVPLSSWQIDYNHNLGIFEAGISKTNEMAWLEPMIKPTVGIFTNIGDAHSEGFKDVKQKIQEKLKLFIHAEYLIYSADYTAITEVVDYMKTQSAVKYQFQSITWSKKEALRDEVDLYITTIEKGDTYTTIQGLYQDKTGAIRIPFTDDASIENAIHCWLLLLHWGYNDMVILERMMQLSPVEMRLEIKGGINGCTLISDCYNSDLNALTIALDFLEHQNQNYNRTLILSDILGAKSTAEVLYQKVADLLAEKSVNRIIGIGENIQQYGYLFDVAQKQFFTGTDEFLADFPSFQQETVLIKGARSFAFERIVQKMSQKAHNTVLEINLNAMAHNLKTYRSLLKPKTKIMAMVKAFAYGSGTFEIANLLQYNKVDYLAVAYTDEGVELRKAGVTLPIMVMNPEPSTFEAVVQYKLEPEIYSLSHLQKFEQHLKASIANPTLPFPIHLKIDTGMHRLGFDENDVNRLIKRLKTSAYFKIKSVFSHLAAADDAKHDEFTSQQLIRFNLIYKEISKKFSYPIMRHMLNSAGIVRFAQVAQMDMVRLGLGLYGIDTTGEIQGQLENVSSLKTYVSQIKMVKGQDTVGYNRAGVLRKPTKIATISIGYGDGLSRRLSNGRGKMRVNGQIAPIIGNICMDMCMLDVTHIVNVQEGDTVVVFDKERPVEVLAQQLNTIPYEVLTGITARVKRVYFQA